MNSFEDIIRQKIIDRQAAVPSDAWKNIKRKKRKKRFIFFWFTIAAFVLSGFLMWSYLNDANNSNKISSGVEKTKINDNTDKTIGNKISKSENNKNESVDKAVSKRNLNTDSPEIIKTVNGNNDASGTGPVIKTETTGTVNKNSNAVKKETYADVTTTNSPISKIVKNKTTGRAAVDDEVKTTKEDDVLATRKNITDKTKSKTKATITGGETGTDNDVKDNTENIIPGNSNEPVTDVVIKESINKPAELTCDSTANITAAPLVKDESADSVQKKDAILFPNENNKEKATAKKQSRKHTWFIDVAASPVFPVQESNHDVTFNRTLFSSDSRSVFSGKLVTTSIDPSAAFSISVRRSFGKKFFAGIGLQYLQLKEHVKISGTETNIKYSVVDSLVNSVSGPQFINDTIATITESQKTIRVTSSYHFISIPLLLQYNFIQNRSWSFSGVAGVVMDIYGNYKKGGNEESAVQLVNTSQMIASKNSVHFSLYGGLRFGQMLTKRIEIFGLPYINWYMKQQEVKNSLINKKIQRTGISVGISFKLK